MITEGEIRNQEDKDSECSDQDPQQALFEWSLIDIGSGAIQVQRVKDHSKVGPHYQGKQAHFGKGVILEHGIRMESTCPSALVNNIVNPLTGIHEVGTQQNESNHSYEEHCHPYP